MQSYTLTQRYYCWKILGTSCVVRIAWRMHRNNFVQGMSVCLSVWSHYYPQAMHILCLILVFKASILQYSRSVWNCSNVSKCTLKLEIKKLYTIPFFSGVKCVYCFVNCRKTQHVENLEQGKTFHYRMVNLDFDRVVECYINMFCCFPDDLGTKATSVLSNQTQEIELGKV